MKGQEGVRAFAGASTNLGVKALTLTSTDVYGDSSMVVEEGTYTTDYGNGKAPEKGKYLVVWKPENGQWKMYRDIFNSDAPPATKQASGKLAIHIRLVFVDNSCKETADWRQNCTVIYHFIIRASEDMQMKAFYNMPLYAFY